MELSDCVQEGTIGLIKAAKKYDGRGNFGSYARRWIKQEIRLALFQKYQNVRIPQHWYDKMAAFRKAKATMKPDATFDDVADRMKLTPTKRRHLRDAFHAHEVFNRWPQQFSMQF